MLNRQIFLVNTFLFFLFPSVKLLAFHGDVSTNKHWQEDHEGSAGQIVIGSRDMKIVFQQQTSPIFRRQEQPVRIGMMWEGDASVGWEIRKQDDVGKWGEWQSLPRVWSEQNLHNNHLDIKQRTVAIQIRYMGPIPPTFIKLVWLTSIGEKKTIIFGEKEPVSRKKPQTQNNGVFHPRKDWNAKAAKCSSKDKNKKKMAIHHTAGSNTASDPKAKMRQIQNFHQGTRGWCDIGYHFVVSHDGEVWEGRPNDVLGAHAGGGNNSGNLGICMMGDFRTHIPPAKMLCGLKKIMDWGIQTFNIKKDRQTIKGHGEHPNQSTACPGTELLNRISDLITKSVTNYCGSSTTLTADLVTSKLKGAYAGIGSSQASTCTEQTFELIATFSNSGNITWEDSQSTNKGKSIQFHWVSGEKFGTTGGLSLTKATKKTVSSGEETTFTLSLTSPKNPGTYKSVWQLKDGSTSFGPQITFSIHVSSSPTGSGLSCSTGKPGVCVVGKTSCEKGKLVCIGTQSPTTEVCDGKDNNCDGKVDENCSCKDGDSQSCYSGTKESKGKGACKEGTQVCKNQKWQPCQGEILPSLELCDKKDNDCDGKIDEECSCKDDETKDCYSGAQGTADVGLCKKGKQTCKNGHWGPCLEQVLPSVETCNGKDDNCNGVVDDGCSCKNGEEKSCYFGPTPTKNVGLCKSGLMHCKDGSWSACENQVLPSIEVCDGKDNDCDGKVDNGNPGGNTSCKSQSTKESCQEGTTKCISGKLVCVTPQNCFQQENLPDGSIPKDIDDTIVLRPKQCQKNSECEENEECSEGQCQPKKPNNDGCSCSSGKISSNGFFVFLGFFAFLFFGLRRRK